MTDLILKRTTPTGDQYEVLTGDQVVGHIRLSDAAPAQEPVNAMIDEAVAHAFGNPEAEIEDDKIAQQATKPATTRKRIVWIVMIGSPHSA